MNRISQSASCRIAAAILTAASLASGVANAGTATVDAGDGNAATFEYNDSMLRISSAMDTSSYAVFRDGSLFTVSNSGGQPMVIDAGAMMKSMGNTGMVPPSVTSQIDGKLLSLEDTGEDETIAGIAGDVYAVRFEDEDGNLREETLVLSTDSRVREFNDAMFRMMSLATQLAPAGAVEQGQEFRQRLESLNAGVLRFGADMRVTSINGEAVAAERFALPAQPMSLEGIGAMMGAMRNQAAGQQ